MADRSTITTLEVLRSRANDDSLGLLFENSKWSWREFIQEAAERAHFLLHHRDRRKPFHIGVMLENVPDYLFLISAAAMTGAAIVGINLTRKGEELAEDIRFTDCQMIITDSTLSTRLDGLDIGTDQIWTIDSPEYKSELTRNVAAPIPEVADAHNPASRLLLLFTSGSTGRPKAVICTTGRFARIAEGRHMGLGPEDISYNSMPLFHGNALMACWANPLYTGGAFAMARKFSASRFLDDVLKFRATYFNYVGRALSYVLAQPEQPQERHTRLKIAFGTEASQHDLTEFERRFGIAPTESYGASEGGLSLRRTPAAPASSLGESPPGVRAAVLDPDTLTECPRAVFDENGLLLNADEATGEIANLDGAAKFEGYYNNSEAFRERVRGSIFLTGDLGYRDGSGYFYFAGRGSDWLRVDSENFSAAPIERILSRYPNVRLVAVYPVPDEQTGDQVMATLQFASLADFDPTSFAVFLAEQADLGTKWAPRYVRVVSDVPVTATGKIDKSALRRERWDVEDVVYFRPSPVFTYRVLDSWDRKRILHAFTSNNRRSLLS